MDSSFNKVIEGALVFAVYFLFVANFYAVSVI